jgi:peptide/nickel transport system substrate-binding protein
MLKKRLLLIPLALLLIISLLLGACTPAATEAPEEPAPTEAVPTEAAPAEAVTKAPTAPAPTESPTAEVSKVGGTLKLAMTADPDTFDPSKMASAVASYVMGFVGASLVTVAEDGTYVPYLAESWEVSEDGLTYTFKLRQDITFHNGDPLTAKDVAFTYNRALDPEIASPATGPQLGSVTSITALDDYSVEFILAAPNFPFLFALSDPSYMAIIPQSYTEEMGDDIGRNPISAGPYQFSEWVTGDHVTLERNPDFNWGPANWKNTGPWFIENIEFQIIPDLSTILAGQEAGEIDYAGAQPQDVQLLRDAGMEIFQSSAQGINPYLTLNNSKPPFDDINVRKAFNLAIDREAMIALLLQGNGVTQYGPLSSGVIGYWAGVEDYGYPFNIDEAKSLMEAAGYTYNADGMAEKDGVVLALTLYTLPVESWVKAAEVLQQQLQALGVEITIEQGDQGVLIPQVFAGDYQVSMFGMTYQESDLMYLMFHSSQIGAFDFAYVNDPVLDEILERTRTEIDQTLHQQAVNEAQQYITENAFVIPLYTPKTFGALNPRVKGAYFNNLTGIAFNAATIEE